MATGRFSLHCPGGITPGSGAPFWQRIKSSGTVTNGPSISTSRLSLDASTDTAWFWQFLLPGDYVSGGTLRIKWGCDGTTGNVILKAALGAVIDGTTNTNTFSLNTVLASAATAVPGTSGLTAEMTLAPDATNLAANRMLTVMLGRDADSASDTATSNAWIEVANLEYVI